MTAKKDRTQERIAREKAAKIRFVKVVVGFAQLILPERGEILVRTRGFTHTHTIRELHNFYDFSFYADTGQTMLGGNTVKVWYHPGNQYQRGSSAVLDVWWQIDIETCRFEKFDPNQQWQTAFLKIVERQEKAVVRARRIVPVKRALTKFEEELRDRRRARKEKGEYAL